MSGMLLIGLITAATGLWLMLPEAANGSGWNISKEIVMVLVIGSTVFWLKMLPGIDWHQPDPPVQDIQQPPHLGDECYLHHDLRFLYRDSPPLSPCRLKVIFGYQHLWLMA